MNKQFPRFTFFLSICLTLPLMATAQVVDIPDPHLRAAVEKALSKASGTPITAADMAELTALHAPNANISNLTGLEGATNLTRLDLGENALRDISVLAGLTNLTNLSLDFNNITDISVLTGLTKLTALELGYNAIMDHSILSGLTNLTGLDLRGTHTSDLSVLSGLTNLIDLYIDSNGISDLSPLAGLTNLRRLGLNFNSISNLSALRGLTNLRWMRLVGNNITDLSPLVANTGLGNGDQVLLNDNPLSYPSIKTHIPALQNRGVTVEFDDRTPATLLVILGVITGLNNVLIVEVRDSKGLPFEEVPVIFTVTSGGGTLSVTRTATDENGRAESRLTLRSGGDPNTVRASVEGLSELVTFSDVALDIPDPNLRAAIENALGIPPGTPIVPPQAMAALTRLEARNANISDLTGLEFATNLKDLELGYGQVGNEWRNSNTVSDLSPLASLTQLTSLDLPDNNISDVSVLANLTNLESLSLAGNPVSDILPLTGLTQLTRLNLSHTSIANISALAGLTNLTDLRLEWSKILDLSPLVANTGFGSGDYVYVQGNPLGYLSLQTHIPTLRSRGVTIDLEDTADLNTGEPHTVRLIYFLPNDRPYRPDVVQLMKDRILQVQTFFAEQMEAHGYENKTFRVETDASGEPLVHRVDGQYPDNHYSDYWESIVWNEIGGVFNRYTNIYFIVADTINTNVGSGSRLGKNAGTAVMDSDVGFTGTAHELGHAFGLWHDFRDGSYLMSYGPGSYDRLSACHAEFLAVHPYFNPDTPIEEGPPPTIDFISPHTYPADSKSIPIQLKVSDSDGLHQAILHLGPPDIRNIITVKSCRGLGGKKEAVVQFDYDGVIPFNHNPSYSISTSLLNPLVHPIFAEAVDMNGNVSEKFFFLFSDIYQPLSNISSDTLSKISGDNQQGLPNAPLSQPFVIEVRAANGFTFGGIAVRFAVTTGGGTLSRQHTTTDGNGRASSTLTLGPHWETNAVEVSAAGIEGVVTFTAIADAEAAVAVDIPDPNLRAAIETALSKAESDPITRLEIGTMTHFEARDANISDLTGLEHATNLQSLELGYGKVGNSNAVKDLSPLADLTQLTSLDLAGNSISDISAVTGLTNLTWLHFWGNSISDISPVVGLTNLIDLYLGDNNISDISPLVANTGLGSGDTVYVQYNPLSYQSIHTHIPTLQSRGVTVEFDNRLEMGPNKITGPWLWMIAPTVPGQGGRQSNNVDSLAAASNGDVTEAEVAANGAKEGDTVGNYVWTLGKIAATGGNNINDVINGIGMAQGDVDDHSSYALITLESVTAQSDVTMRVGSDDSIKVWLNGEVVHNKPVNRGASDFQDSFEVNLKQGDNLLLVKVSERAGAWSMFVGIDADVNAVYKRPPDVVMSADVNNDGSVNVLDLVVIAAELGNKGQNLTADVNSDGVVNILDLILVAGMFDGAAAAPAAQPQVPEMLTAVEVQGWLTEARTLKVRDAIMKRGFVVLEQLLTSLIPKETELLPNYPNPFNPETWIPYRLAEDAFVTLTIYDKTGQVVRTLEVGHRIASAYENRSKAIYWDGKNNLGEQVASGVYFYTLRAGEYSATRKMLILK